MEIHLFTIEYLLKYKFLLELNLSKELLKSISLESEIYDAVHYAGQYARLNGTILNKNGFENTKNLVII